MAEAPPHISVIIPARNHARYIGEALASAQRQTAPPREIIVVDDGSTDDTVAAARAVGEPRLQIISQKNSGPSAARNAGWRKARSEFCFFLDADDRVPPGALEALARAARECPNAIPYGVEAVYPESMTGTPAFTATMSARDGSLVEEIAIRYHGTIFTALFSRATLEEIGGFDDTVWFGEDFEFALRLALARDFHHVPKITYEARMHGHNRHRGFSDKARRQYFETIEKNLSPRGASVAAIRKKALAQWHWRFGAEDLNSGNKRGAFQNFLASLRHAPLKLGSWQGLARSLSPR